MFSGCVGLVVAILEHVHYHCTALDPELKGLRIGAQLLERRGILAVSSVFSPFGLGQKILVRFFICLEHKNLLNFHPGWDK